MGDKVLSIDERTQITSYQPVMAVIQGEQRYQLIKITLDSGESLETTKEHPFYIKGKGWNPANSLKVGQALQLHNSSTVVIKEIDTSVRLEKVYNLTVANTHNYFVGDDGVLVHNGKKQCELPALDSTGKVHGTLPKPKDFSKYSVDELELLLDELKEGVEKRIDVTSEKGRDRPHGQRQGQEHKLIKQLEKYLSGS